MTKIEFIYYLTSSIFFVLLIILFVCFLIGLICIWWYERKILVLKRKINNLPKQIKKRIQDHLVNQKQFERIVESERKSLIEELEMLEIKRRFLLDKLPFVK